MFDLVIIHVDGLLGGKVFLSRKCEVVCRVAAYSDAYLPLWYVICYKGKNICAQKNKLSNKFSLNIKLQSQMLNSDIFFKIQ